MEEAGHLGHQPTTFLLKKWKQTTTQLQSNQLSLCWFVGIDCCGGNEKIKYIITVNMFAQQCSFQPNAMNKSIYWFVNEVKVEWASGANMPQPSHSFSFLFHSALWEWADGRKERRNEGHCGPARKQNEWNSWSLKGRSAEYEWNDWLSWLSLLPAAVMGAAAPMAPPKRANVNKSINHEIQWSRKKSKENGVKIAEWKQINEMEFVWWKKTNGMEFAAQWRSCELRDLVAHGA